MLSKHLLVVIVAFLISATQLNAQTTAFVGRARDTTEVGKEFKFKIFLDDSVTCISGRMVSISLPYCKVSQLRIFSDNGKTYFESVLKYGTTYGASHGSTYSTYSGNYVDSLARIELLPLDFLTREYHGRRYESYEDRGVTLRAMLQEHFDRADEVEVEIYLSGH